MNGQKFVLGTILEARARMGLYAHKHERDAAASLWRSVDRGSFIIVTDELSSQRTNLAKGLNDLDRLRVGRLIHELAHVYFFNYLVENKEALFANLPRSVAWKTRGNIVFDETFVAYVNERYAHELQNLFYLWRGDSGNPWGFGSLHSYIVEAYQLKNPLLENLNEFGVDEILSGLPFRR